LKKNSLIKINDYILDKNQRILKKGSIALKITEREIDFIEKLNSSKQPLNKNFILKNIWSYSSETDTHTIETHIYRLRQKIKENFNDKNFIKSTKDGYSIWKREMLLRKICYPGNIKKELLNQKKAKEVLTEKNLG